MKILFIWSLNKRVFSQITNYFWISVKVYAGKAKSRPQWLYDGDNLNMLVAEWLCEWRFQCKDLFDGIFKLSPKWTILNRNSKIRHKNRRLLISGKVEILLYLKIQTPVSGWRIHLKRKLKNFTKTSDEKLTQKNFVSWTEPH